MKMAKPMPDRLPTLLATLLALSCVGCSQLDRLSSERLLALEDGQPSERRPLSLGDGRIRHPGLAVTLTGASETEELEFRDAIDRELVDGELFSSLLPAGAPSAKAPRLEIDLTAKGAHDIDSWLHNEQAHLRRYEADVRLIDSKGVEVLSGYVIGVAYDDRSESAQLTAERKKDIDLAAHRDATRRIADALRARRDGAVGEERGAIRELTLAPGVGPLRLALLDVDLEQAHSRTQRSRVEAELLTSLQLAGPQLELVSPRQVQSARDRNGLDKFPDISLPPDSAKLLRRSLEARLVLLVRVEAQRESTRLEARLIELAEPPREIARSTSKARGLGALSIATARLARQLIIALGEARLAPAERKATRD
jgi:hypothetical protein